MTHRLSLESLLALPTLSLLSASPAGDRAAFYSNRSGRFELYTLDLSTRELRQATHGQAPKAIRAGYVWSPDGARIVFSRDENGDERQALYAADLESGEVTALHHAEGSMDYPVQVHPDGRRLLVNSTRSGQMNVHVYDLSRTGEEAYTPLTAYPAVAEGVCWSPDGTRVAYTTNETPDFRNIDGYLMGEDGSGAERVFHVRPGSQDLIHDWSPDGRTLAVSSDADGNGRIGLLSLHEAGGDGPGEVRWLTPSDGRTEEYVGKFSPDGRWLSAVRNRDSAMTPVLYDTASGEARELRLPAGLVFGSFFALGGSHLLLSHTSGTRRTEVLLYDLATDTYEVLVPAEYGAVDPAVFVEAQYLSYPSFDGQAVPALLYRPQGAEGSGTRYPALVHVHGGPTAQFFRGFDAEAQVLADRGYVVLCPNIRGSSGYGVAWRDANLKDWGGGDLEDVAAGAEYLRTLPFVDPERLGVYGGSFGGFMAYLIAVKKPDLFKVSVPIVGISDLEQLYRDNSRDMPQLGYYFRSLMGDPDTDAELWKDRSAVTHAHHLKAKMFMMHGVNDPRCPVNQARGFRDALLAAGRREGRDFEYLEFADEGHGAGDIAGKIRSSRLLTEYLDRHL